MFPPMELPDCDSTRMVLLYLLTLFKDRSSFTHNEGKTYMAFDDMCHMRRLIEARVDQHPRLNDFLAQVCVCVCVCVVGVAVTCMSVC
jgi:hypothetical protein